MCEPKNTEWRSEETSLCNNGPIFLLCGGFRNNEGIKTAAAGEKPAHWIQHCWSRFRQLQSISYGFVGILYSNRLPFLYSDHLEGRQTVENHLIRIGISTYARNDVINFQFSAFFCGFYFCGSRSVRENRENFPLYSICTSDMSCMRHTEANKPYWLAVVKCILCMWHVANGTQTFLGEYWSDSLIKNYTDCFRQWTSGPLSCYLFWFIHNCLITQMSVWRLIT